MSLADEQKQELACVYAGLLLWDDGIEITSDKLSKVLATAGVTVEPYYPEFFGKYLASTNIGALVGNLGGEPAAAAAVVAAPVEEKQDDKKGGKKDDKKGGKKEEKKPVEEEEEAGFDDLFG